MGKIQYDTAPWLAAAILVAIGLRMGVLGLLALLYGGLAEAMCQFDCGWYERIALHGYGADAEWGDHGSLPHWVFFPVYPTLLRLVSLLLPARVGGLLLSAGFLALFIAAGLFHLRQTRGVVASYTWVAITVFIPTGVFFTALYTESVFAFLATLSLAALATRRPWIAAGAAALASATRPTGIILAPMLLIDRLRALYRVWPLGLPRAALLLAPAALAPLGLIVFSAAQWIAVGDPLAFSHQQILWNRVWTGPWQTIPAGLAAMDLGNLFGTASHTWEALWALLGLTVAVVQARRTFYGEAWFLAACVLLPACTSLDSLPRFVATNPVFLFALHDLLAGHPRRALVCCLLLVGGFVWVANVWMSGAGSVF